MSKTLVDMLLSIQVRLRERAEFHHFDAGKNTDDNAAKIEHLARAIAYLDAAEIVQDEFEKME